jgi:hypothetical protein
MKNHIIYKNFTQTDEKLNVFIQNNLKRLQSILGKKSIKKILSGDLNVEDILSYNRKLSEYFFGKELYSILKEKDIKKLNLLYPKLEAKLIKNRLEMPIRSWNIWEDIPIK